MELIKSKTKKTSKKVTRILRAMTSAIIGRFGKKFEHRPMVPLIEPITDDLIKADIAKMRLLYSSAAGRSEIGVYIAQGYLIPDLMLEIGRMREKVFRTVNEGTGKSCDIDEFDPFYQQLVAIDKNTNKVIGAYRLGLIDKLLKTQGPEGLYSYTLFKYDGILDSHLIDAIELGRSFVDDEAGKMAIRALDCIWKGLGKFISENPHYRYLVGPVSISNSYSDNSKLLMIHYLNKNFKSELITFIKPRKPVKLKSPIDDELRTIAGNLKSFSELDHEIKKYDHSVSPLLLKSYAKIGAKYMGFNFDPDFNTIDGMIIVDLLNAPQDEVIKHMGNDSYQIFLKNYNSGH